MNIKSEKAKKIIDRVVNYDRLDDAAQRLLYEAVEIAEEEMMQKALKIYCNADCGINKCELECSEYRNFRNLLTN